jgi:hypothetical protein
MDELPSLDGTLKLSEFVGWRGLTAQEDLEVERCSLCALG